MHTAATKLLDKAIRDHMVPVLQADGFSGSGRTFRRVRGDLIHVLHIQGSRYGGQFAVNLAVHLAFLPDGLGNAIDVRKIADPDCELRRRLSASGSDQWWKYCNDTADVCSAVQAATQVYADHGRRFYERFGSYPESFSNLCASELEKEIHDFAEFATTTTRLALFFARVRTHEGQKYEAAEFAKLGLKVCGAKFSGRLEFEKLSQIT